MTEEKKEEPGNLGLMGRLLLILVLFNQAARADLFSFRTSGAALLTAAYVGALLVMTGFLVALWRKAATAPHPAEPWLAPKAPRHFYGLFCEPWYQVPAVSCMAVVGIGFVSDLLAAPPESTRSKWFLALLGFTVLVGTVKQSANVRSYSDQNPRGTTKAPRGERPARGPLSDPFFRKSLVAFSVLLVASEGVARIDNEPSSALTWAFSVASVALAALAIYQLVSDLARKQESAQ